MMLLGQYHFRLPILRFVIDLFDRRVLRRIVLDEEDSDSEEDAASEEDANDQDTATAFVGDE